jgi:hypothetical protein
MTHDTRESMIADMLPVVGEFDALIVRADGTVERRHIHNVVTRYGLNRLAARAINATGQTPAYVLGVGTVSAANSIGSGVTNFGEVSRKQASTIVQSQDWFALTMTWAGDTDSLTGIALDSVAILDHVDSGQGIAFNIANGLAVTLQASDFLNLTGRIRVGSHDLGHTT